MALVVALAVTTTTAPTASAASGRPGITYAGHRLTAVPFTAVHLVRYPRTVVGLLDGRAIIARQVGRRLVMTLPPGALATPAARLGWRHRVCVWSVTAVLLALGVAGITAVLIAAGPEATEISIAGRMVSREALKEVRILLTTGSSVSAFITGQVCR